MNRVYNFSAGPSMLPVPVLQKAQADLLDYHGSGMSVMEMSHRSKWFDEIIQNTEAGIRKVLNVPDNYKIGFFQGGAVCDGTTELYDHRHGGLSGDRQLQQKGCRGSR